MSQATSTFDAPPRSLVCVKADTLGDLVLFSPTLRALRSGFPSARIAVVIREAYQALAPMLAPGIEWITTPIDSFIEGPSAWHHELSRLQAEIAGRKPELFIAATAQQSWLELALAATSGATRRIGFSGQTQNHFFSTELRLKAGIDPANAFTELVTRDPGEPCDWESNFALADAALGARTPRVRPTLSAPGSEATSTLAAFSLEPQRYCICAPAGYANVRLKTWPSDRFARSLRHVRERYRLALLLIGSHSEREHLDSVARECGGAVAIWTGDRNTLPLLTGLIANAALFLGNDTGAMHLAAALDIPVAAVFGGGTWPRFKPAATRAVSVVHPLPCFGCGWDCAFGDAPCIRLIETDDLIAAIDTLMAKGAPSFSRDKAIHRLSAETVGMMAKSAAQYRTARAGHLARQHKLEEMAHLDREKDEAITAADRAMREKDASLRDKEAEILALKRVCDERERLIIDLDGRRRIAEDESATARADKALIEKTLIDLPMDRGQAVHTIATQAAHIRNLQAMVQIKEHEIAELQATQTNLHAGLHTLEQAKHYGRLLAEKEAVIRELNHGCKQREAVIRELTANTTSVSEKAWRLWRAAAAVAREKAVRPISRWLMGRWIATHWMQIGILDQYVPRPLAWESRRRCHLPTEQSPQIAVVTPSYGQAPYIESTMRSVLEQDYPKLRYVVQDGGSKDGSADIIRRYADRLHHWESAADNGQADAIRRGFNQVSSSLEATDVMAWLNSDDLYAPGTLRTVGHYFARHPEVDVVYGHRIIIDGHDREIGRWIMPRHDSATLEWIDYVPQETLFWRKRIWEMVGGIDPTFQFALDWDLLARFQQAGARIVRLPYFLGAFRVHATQKTTQDIHTTGAEEMRRIRARFHGTRAEQPETIERHARRTKRNGVITARLLELGIRW